MRVKARIVNGHYQLRCDQHLNLHQLKVLLPEGRLYMGRPTMLSCRLMGKRVLFFPSGTIQVLAGNMTSMHFERLHAMICELLTYSSTNPAVATVIRVSPWTVNNMVVYFELCSTFTFSGLLCNGRLSYEPELFPALLVSKKANVHVTLFQNGKGVVTGVRSALKAIDALQELVLELRHRVRRRPTS